MTFMCTGKPQRLGGHFISILALWWRPRAEPAGVSEVGPSTVPFLWEPRLMHALSETLLLDQQTRRPRLADITNQSQCPFPPSLHSASESFLALFGFFPVEESSVCRAWPPTGNHS